MPRRLTPKRLRYLLLSAILLAGGRVLAAAAPLPAQPPLEVAQWRWADAIQDRQPIGNYQRYAPNQPLYFWFELHGTQAALDDLQSGRPLRVAVHWQRVNGQTPGAPDLVTELSVGDPGLVDRLAHEIREPAKRR